MPFTEQLNHNVTFRTADGLLAAGGAVHAFSTRLGGVSRGIWASMNLGVTRGDDPAAVEENYRRFRLAMGGTEGPLVKTNQIHEATVRTVTAADLGKGLHEREPDADGLITNLPGVTLAIYSADCIPVLLYDPVNRVIAAAHAGWRGTAKQIAAAAAGKMISDYGCDPAHIRAGIGPGIGQCCFETHGEVPEAMLNAYGPKARDYILDLGNGKFRVDLKGLNGLALRNAGVPGENIDIDTDCTACHTEKYWSHRRVGQARGSMAALIELL